MRQQLWRCIVIPGYTSRLVSRQLKRFRQTFWL
jgi:hypothetical protein